VTRRLLVLLSLALAACGSSRDDDRRRYVSPTEHFSIHEPSGWSAGRDHGTDTFRSPDQRTVIAVRSVANDPDRVEPRRADLVLGATEKVLAALPGAEVRGPVVLDELRYRAWAFDVRFTPPDKQKRVWRRHVVVWGSEHLFHVMVTTTDPELAEPAAKAFAEVLASLREEA
jgi:hypothetical protein